MKVLIYLRKSREDVDRDRTTGEDTLANHRKLLTRLSKERKYEYTMREEIESGDSISGRPVFQEVLEIIGNYDGIVVTEISRLGRGDMEDAGRIINTLKRSNVLIITPNKTYDLHDKMDARHVRFELFIAKEEYEYIKERLQRGKAARHEAGLPVVGAQFTLGLDNIRGKIVLNEKEWGEAINIFNKLLELESYAHTADWCNQMGYVTKRGTRYHTTTISKMAANPLYNGSYRYKGKVFPGQFPKIIDDNTWAKIQLLRSKLTKPCPGKRDTPYYLTIYCTSCGRIMHGDMQTHQKISNPHKVRKYRCSTHKNNWIRKDEIDKIITSKMTDMLAEPKVLQKIINNQAASTQQEIDKIMKNIADLDKAIAKEQSFLERLNNDYRAGDITAKIFNKMYSQTEEQISALRKEKNLLCIKTNSLENSVEDDKTYIARLQKIISRWGRATNSEKALAVSAIFPRIEYSRHDSRMNIFTVWDKSPLS